MAKTHGPHGPLIFGILRRMDAQRDMSEVLAIESDSFEFPWSEEDFRRCLDQRNVGALVLEQGDRVVGYMIFDERCKRLHLLNLAVHADRRRRGVAGSLISVLAAHVRSGMRKGILAEVRETNLGAQLFFKSLGFRAVSVLKDFYDDTDEDAYLFQYPVEGEVRP